MRFPFQVNSNHRNLSINFHVMTRLKTYPKIGKNSKMFLMHKFGEISPTFWKVTWNIKSPFLRASAPLLKLFYSLRNLTIILEVMNSIKFEEKK